MKKLIITLVVTIFTLECYSADINSKESQDPLFTSYQSKRKDYLIKDDYQYHLKKYHTKNFVRNLDFGYTWSVNNTTEQINNLFTASYGHNYPISQYN